MLHAGCPARIVALAALLVIPMVACGSSSPKPVSGGAGTGGGAGQTGGASTSGAAGATGAAGAGVAGATGAAGTGAAGHPSSATCRDTECPARLRDRCRQTRYSCNRRRDAGCRR